MLEKVKLSMRISTNTFDSQLNDLINAAFEDLRIAGVESVGESTSVPFQSTTTNPLVILAVTTYCKIHFNEAKDERLIASYNEQKAQLRTATNYTKWSE